MRLHELRKTLAWYSRGLFGGSQLRQRSFAVHEPAGLLELGEGFFGELEARAAAGRSDVHAAPADPIAKSIARNGRRDPLPNEPVPCAAAS